ncbi:hypothetical protein [Paraburkholderia aromaticivorans]|uniref:hypothetical protein n=1 Tax=Paraburkholderia aromaticivorans TaxID=2026199 RepID=UPI0014561390|nr:hypothetical protein [Paraburkholderia aromaticivorans]
MTLVPVLALSKWAHHSWLAAGERSLSERAQAAANARLLALFPHLLSQRATPSLPRFAALPRPACAKVMRVTAALAYAASLRKVVSASEHEMFAARIAPHVLRAVQRDPRGGHENANVGVMLDVLDRADMTAAGMQLTLHALGDPTLRVLLELRLPRAVAQRAARFGVCGMSSEAAMNLLDAAYVLTGGSAC